MTISKCLVGALLGFLAVSCTPAQADTSLILGGVSHHIGEREYTYHGETRTFNELNPSIGVEVDNFSVFAFKNSYYEPSFGVGYTFKHELNDYATAGLRVAAVTGYKDTPMDMAVMPFGGPELDLHKGRYHAVVGFMPTFSYPTWAVLTLNFKYDL